MQLPQLLQHDSAAAVGRSALATESAQRAAASGSATAARGCRCCCIQQGLCNRRVQEHASLLAAGCCSCRYAATLPVWSGTAVWCARTQATATGTGVVGAAGCRNASGVGLGEQPYGEAESGAPWSAAVPGSPFGPSSPQCTVHLHSSVQECGAECGAEPGHGVVRARSALAPDRAVHCWARAESGRYEFWVLRSQRVQYLLVDLQMQGRWMPPRFLPKCHQISG
jgi:hypothetical protein